MTTAYEDIRLELDGAVAVVTLARPKTLNSLRAQTVRELNRALDEIEANNAIKVIVLGAEGDRAFSAGIDMVSDPPPANTMDIDDTTYRNAKLIERFWYSPKIVINAVKGVALAAGCNLALIGDLTVCGESASFGEPEIRHGTLSPLLLLPWLTHLKLANQMYLTGDSVSADEALRAGLVNKVVPDDTVDEAALAMAKRIANAPLLTLRTVKRSVRMMLDTQGFAGLQAAHRFADTLVLDSSGVPEREVLKKIRQEQGLKAFIEHRDAPYRD